MHVMDAAAPTPPAALPQQLSPHFSLAAFTWSDTAIRLGLDNRLPPGLLRAALDTAAMLERIRAELCQLCLLYTSDAADE